MGDDMVHRVAAESWRGIFLHLDASAAEAEGFRTRSLGERGA
jgi:hypothetical protein